MRRVKQLEREVKYLQETCDRLRRVAEAQAADAIRSRVERDRWRNVARCYYQVESEVDRVVAEQFYEQAVQCDR